MCKILIVDDDKELCKLIRRSVIHENIEAEYCYSGLFAIKKIKEEKYELLILDVMMPDMDGFETLERIREFSNVPILMLTSKDSSSSKVIGLRSGADDYLTKPFDMDELIARIISLIRRYVSFQDREKDVSKLVYNGLTIDLNYRSVSSKQGTFELPPKEFDVLLYLVKNQGKILTKQMIYEEVWQEEYFFDDSNIMAIISRLRKKIESDTNSPYFIQTVKGVGYRFNKEV
ncbi:TPA: response regulator transcription factor [Enterococcus faecium]|nr:response regulator transcription factor [Enterococcus faecium]HBM4379045.1 response regulator transcription factor [Enterococcus faecium]HBM4422198.1 response regulator transcription factor [Enterococcus faecium]HBM4422706.1 response regulator transcription factor [Enterococcus faecium]